MADAVIEARVTLANPQLWEGRIAWAEAPRSLWEGPEFSETVRRILPWIGFLAKVREAEAIRYNFRS